MLNAAPAAPPSLWPLGVLAISVVLLVVLIRGLRVPAFLALVLAAFAAGLMADQLPGESGTNHLILAIELTATELGVTAGKIAIVIGLAAVIGTCLVESGAADKIVRRFLAWFGPSHAGTALFLCSYFLSIPIFFDTFVILLLPLARALALRTGKDYLLYVLAISGSAAITHSMCAPHPGPLAMAEALHLDVGLTMIVGIVAGIGPAAAGWWAARRLNRGRVIPLRPITGIPERDAREMLDRPEHELPGLLSAALPILLPLVLIAAASFAEALRRAGSLPAWGGGWNGWLQFLGNRNVALLAGALAGVLLVLRQRRFTAARLGELLEGPLATAGVVILITSAGGAFGLMLKNAGVGDAVKVLVAGHDVNLVLLAWLVAALIRVAQGSATVAMLTAAAMVYPLISGGTPLPYHPLYIFMAIGFGAMVFSWMNDSGFWVISRLAGFTEAETLRTWTVVVTVNSVAGLLLCLLGAKLLPFAVR